MQGSRPQKGNVGTVVCSAEKQSTRRKFLQHTSISAAGVLVGCGSTEKIKGRDATPPSVDAGFIDPGHDASSNDSSTRPVPDSSSVVEVFDPLSIAISTSFPFAVAAGDMTSTSCVFWTTYTGSQRVEFIVWEQQDTNEVSIFHREAAALDEQGVAHIDVSGFISGQTYSYGFFELSEDENREARSSIGNVRMAPAEDFRGSITLGAVSCTLNGLPFHTLEQAALHSELDAFLYLGDNVYCDGSTTRRDFRRKWAENLSTEGYRSLRAAFGMYATWDDHEVQDNWNPETGSAQVLDNAVETFFEHSPLRRFSEDPTRIWRSSRWGQTLELFVLDGRTERRPSTRHGNEAEYLSREQLEWLKDGLASSNAVFKVVLNSVGISDFPALFFLDEDRWEGYAAQREELLSFIDEENIRGVLWVAGDFHYTSLGRVGSNDQALGWKQWEVLVGPGSQYPNPLYTTCVGPQYRFSSGTNNVTLMRFEPEEEQVHFQWLDGDGNLFRTEIVDFSSDDS